MQTRTIKTYEASLVYDVHGSLPPVDGRPARSLRSRRRLHGTIHLEKRQEVQQMSESVLDMSSRATGAL
jgi:hypothetical protein